MRKAKTQIELYIARDINGNEKKFYRFISNKRKAREDMGPLWKKTEDLIMRDTKKAEVLNDFFASVFTSKGSGYTIKLQKAKVRTWRRKICLL